MVIGAGGLYRVQIPEILAIQNKQHAGLGRLGDARGRARRLGGDLVLGSRSASRARACRTARSRSSGSSSASIAVLGGARDLRSSTGNRGQSVGVVEGVPIVVPIVLVILWIGTFVLDRTRYGRYIYAIGGNAEAARRAGVKVVLIRWTAFIVLLDARGRRRACSRSARSARSTPPPVARSCSPVSRRPSSAA